MNNVIISLALLLGTAAAPPAQENKPKPTAPAEAPAEPKIKVGDMAPDFTLLDQNLKVVKLSHFRGKKNVALGFFVFAFTGG